jgi:hypothetical protein
MRGPVSLCCRSLGVFREVISPRSNFRPSLSISSLVNSSLKTMCDDPEAMKGRWTILTEGKKSITTSFCDRLLFLCSLLVTVGGE